MKYLHDVVKVTDIESLHFDYPEGTLVLTDNQAVIDACNEKKQPVVAFEHDGVMEMINPQGYQNVLIATGILYVIALLVCFILVRPSGKAAEAKAAKKKAKAEA